MSTQHFYESPINKALEAKIEKMLKDHEIIKHDMDSTEVSGLLSLYMKRALEYALRHYTKPTEL